MTIDQLYHIYLKHNKVTTDSRKIEKGCLFFALKGVNFNGNKFAEEAINKGAAYAIIDEKEFAVGQNTIVVNNVLETLQQLANYHRKKLKIPVIGITGSNGKTTTKELIAAVLSVDYNIIYTQGNLNNHIGVPLTLLELNEGTQMGIIEMGANHEGEIEALCSIADPDYGIITNIGIAHIEGFGSFETVKRTKAELYKHLMGIGGLIFYNSDNRVLSELVVNAERKVAYGTINADLTGELVSAAPYLKAKVNFPKQSQEIESRLIGSYNFENLMAAACIGHYFGISPESVKAALSGYLPQNNRSQMIERGKLKIVMDAYNANPSSMKASIESFISVFKSSRHLILGEMRELGDISQKEHRAILKLIAQNDYDNVYLIGGEFIKVAKEYPYKSFLSVDDLINYLQEHHLAAGAVLIKGSRGNQLEKVLEYI